MKKAAAIVLAALACALLCSPAGALTSADVLHRVQAAEAGVTDMKAQMVITDANKGNVKELGKKWGDILMLEDATIYYKKPDKIRMDGVAKGIKATYIQNGYGKLVLAAMIRATDNLKNKPGKMQDTLDLGFLSSWLWTNNYVSIVSQGKDGVVQLKFDPKFGDKDKRHDMVWVELKTLKVLKREKHGAGGDLKYRYTYANSQMLGRKLPIATESKMYAGDGGFLGTVNYKNVKANNGLSDSLFSLAQR